jgi:type IV pilus assembly protein PilW
MNSASFAGLRPARRHAGMTLIELMVAIALGLVVLTIVLQIFLSSRQAYRVSDNLSRVQEQARYLADQMSNVVRMIDYVGCRAPWKSGMTTGVPNQSIASPASWETFSAGVAAFQMPASLLTAATVPPELTQAEVKPGTSVLRVQAAIGTPARLTQTMGALNTDITISGNPAEIAAGDLLMISDCTGGEIFLARGVVPGAETTISHTALSKKYAKYQSEVIRFRTSVYYVGSGTAAAGGNVCPLNALCVKMPQPAPGGGAALVVQQLANNVDDLQLRFSEDTSLTKDKIPDVAVKANAVTDWSNVIALRISLLLSTNDNGLSETSRTYVFDGAAHTPGDTRLRRSYSTTVFLRNRAT